MHGDDFAIVGPAKELEWMKNGLAQACEIKAEFLGLAKETYQSELGIPNRIVRWTTHGLEYGADQRHAEFISMPAWPTAS